MDYSHTNACNKRLLLNAESFGFGPTVAVASIFPHLRGRFDHIGYVGSGHTLEIQASLPYDAIYDFSSLSGPRLERAVGELSSDYDLFFTAMDFEMLRRFKDTGMTGTSYDALSWYWKDLPFGATDGDMYIAQDFFGVRERLTREAKQIIDETHIVPPIVSRHKRNQDPSSVLVNLGGLQNPFWTFDDAVLYAQKMVEAIRSVVPENETLVICANQAISEKIGNPSRVYSRQEMHEVLKDSKYAFMTSGLGNIYDAAAYDLKTIWLPPANDSQGQQVDLLKKHGMADGAVDWGCSRDDVGLGYKGEQQIVVDHIAREVHQTQTRYLVEGLKREWSKLTQLPQSKIGSLLDRFGTDGEGLIADHLYAFAMASNKHTRAESQEINYAQS